MWLKPKLTQTLHNYSSFYLYIVWLFWTRFKVFRTSFCPTSTGLLNWNFNSTRFDWTLCYLRLLPSKSLPPNMTMFMAITSELALPSLLLLLLPLNWKLINFKNYIKVNSESCQSESSKFGPRYLSGQYQNQRTEV